MPFYLFFFFATRWERVFQTHSNSIYEINVKRKGLVRQAKLYYLRKRTGKSARIKERLK